MRKYDSYDRDYDDDVYYEDEKPRYRSSASMYRDDRHYYDDDYEYEDYRSYYRSNPDHYKHGRSSFVLPNEDIAELIMNATSFGEYITRHGYHFTTALADCASKKLVNANGREHKWTSDQIRQHLSMLGITDLGKCTLGDITFLANMAYADFYPDVLPSENACIKYAIAVSKDPDGYEGIVFSRWVADLIGKRITTIEWEKYI